MKVGILTNMDARCGNAEYGRELCRNLQKHCHCVLGSDEMRLLDVDVIIINYHPAKVPITVNTVIRYKSIGKRVIIIHQNSSDARADVSIGDVLNVADAVVTHEPMEGNNVKFHYIPIGVIDGAELPLYSHKPMVGFAGFPFQWKRLDVVAEVAKRFNIKCRLIVPQSPMLNTEAYVEGIRGHLGSLADIRTGWFSETGVVRLLAACTFTCFWFQSQSFEDTLGQSGSSRLGLAARRPMIISKHRKFRTLLPFWDELYIAGTEDAVYHAAESILVNPKVAKKPARVIKEMGWLTTTQQYMSLITDLHERKAS